MRTLAAIHAVYAIGFIGSAVFLWYAYAMISYHRLQ
jgi:hypothetical protein